MMLYLFFYGGARPGPLVGLVPVFLCMAADWTAATAPSKGLQQLFFANYDLSGGKLGARQLPGLQDLVFFCLVFFKRPSYEADSVLRHVGSPPLAGQAGTVGHTAMDEPARVLFWNPPFPPGLCRWRR